MEQVISATRLNNFATMFNYANTLCKNVVNNDINITFFIYVLIDKETQRIIFEAIHRKKKEFISIHFEIVEIDVNYGIVEIELWNGYTQNNSKYTLGSERETTNSILINDSEYIECFNYWLKLLSDNNNKLVYERI